MPSGGQNKRKIEEVERIVNELGYELLGEYLDEKSRRKVIILDVNGYKYDCLLTNLMRSNNPKFIHISNSFSLENFSVWLQSNRPDFKLCEGNKYIGGKDELKFYCTSCDDYFYSSSNQILGGHGCAVCHGLQVGEKHSLAHLRQDLMIDWSDDNKISPYEIPQFSSAKVIWECHKCDYKWKTNVSTRTHLGRNCPACAGQVVTNRNRLSIRFSGIANEWDYDRNLDTPDDVSFGTNKKRWWKCSKGHSSYLSSISDRTGKKSDCPTCNNSKGERAINGWLTKNNIEFSIQVKFEKCKLDRLLSFDFYLPNYNMCVEYDGILHYIDKFNNQKEFKLTQKRDKIKTKYCKDNNIKLLRIPYWDFDNIEKILEQTLFI